MLPNTTLEKEIEDLLEAVIHSAFLPKKTSHFEVNGDRPILGYNNTACSHRHSGTFVTL